ncbi:DUF3422 family protein [Maricaulaceae bacterium MS644]
MSRSGDWRDSAFVDRERAVDEIHLRASHPIRPYARVSHMIRVLRSPSDLFREELYERYWSAKQGRRKKRREKAEDYCPADWLTPPVDLGDHDLEKINTAIRRRRRAAQSRQDLAKNAMRALRSLPSSDNPLLEAFAPGKTLEAAQAKVLLKFKECMSVIGGPDRYGDSLAGQTRTAVEEMAKLVALYGDNKILDPKSSVHAAPAEPQADGREPFNRLSPFTPGAGPIDPAARLSTRRLLLNLWKPDGETESDRLRLQWELYDANHNFTFFEDFHDSAEAESCGFFAPHDDPRVVDTSNTALRSANSAFTALMGKDQFVWRGELFALSHFFVLPIDAVLQARLPDEAAAQASRRLQEACLTGRPETVAGDPDFIALLEREARRYLRFPDKTRATGERSDFIMTLVHGGAAVLISDLRPHSRTEYHLERAARTLIFDIALTNEQRGRLLKTCTDLATYRMMGVRSYANFFPATEVFNDAAEELSERTFQLTGSDLKDRLREIASISERVAAMNFFVTDGVNGAASQAANFARLAQDRLLSLDETRLRGFQSVADVISRFLSSTLNARRFAERYEQVRRRIAEANDLMRAELDYGIQNRIGHLTLIAVFFGSIAALASAGPLIWPIIFR